MDMDDDAIGSTGIVTVSLYNGRSSAFNKLMPCTITLYWAHRDRLNSIRVVLAVCVCVCERERAITESIVS
jgi:hypothetical protein